MSSLRLPMLSPPGIATRASPQRASSGPSTLIDARIRVTSSYGASGRERRRRVDRELVVAGPLDAGADGAQHSSITSRSATGWHVAQQVTPGASSAAAICFSPAFLVAPETCDDAVERTVGPDAGTRPSATDCYGAGSSAVAARRTRRSPPACRPTEAHRLALGLDAQPLATSEAVPATLTARLAPCTASGGCAAIVARARSPCSRARRPVTSRSASPMR